MSVITADRLARIQELSLARLAELFPHARFIDDTEIILDAGIGATADITNLLTLLEKNDALLEEEILEHFWGSLLPAMRDASEGRCVPQLERREVLATVTKVVHHRDALPDFCEGFPVAEELIFVYALRVDEILQVMPLSLLTDLVDLEVLDAAANAKIKAYSRGLDVIREMGGVLVRGLRQTPSIALLIDDCARNLKLTPCDEGYFVAVPTREHVAIVPATRADMLLPLVELTLGTYAQGEAQPLVPWVYHVRQGHFHQLFGPQGVTLNDELRALHGPFAAWPLEEGYWGDNYSGDLSDVGGW
ncbi:hypothetical protein GCM10027595_13680 [Corynebacterium nasicanis]